MCKFCNNTPMRLLVRPLTNINEVEAVKAALDRLADDIDAQSEETDEGYVIRTPKGDALLAQYHHIHEVAALRVGPYTEARVVINRVRSYK